MVTAQPSREHRKASKIRLSEEIHEVVEPIEQYRAGGYYPVRLGGHFNQRFEIIGKVTYSQYSTIRLVKDHTANIPRYGSQNINSEQLVP